MRADRLVGLLLLLQARGKMRATELATELEVSVRTIYRDLEALSAAGVPVYTDSGPGGGCSILAGYRTSLTGLSPEETAALLAVGVSGPAADLGLAGPLAAARLKLLAALPAEHRGRDGGGPRFHLDPPAWFRKPEPAPCLPELVDAVLHDRRVRIRHGDGGRNRTVDPLGLVDKAGTWYLVARCRKGTTAYRVSRIDRATALDQTFERPADFDLAGFWMAWLEEFESSRPRIAVTVRLDQSVFAVLPEVFGDNVRAAMSEASRPDDDGRRTLTLTFESELAAAHRLLGFGGGIEVVEPSAVRERIVHGARTALERYAAAATATPTPTAT